MVFVEITKNNLQSYSADLISVSGFLDKKKQENERQVRFRFYFQLRKSEIQTNPHLASVMEYGFEGRLCIPTVGRLKVE